MKRIFAFLISAVLILGARLWADPPGRVGRINHISGSVSSELTGTNQWTSAELNYPLTTGDRLATDFNSMAELHIGSTAVRLDSNTEASFERLDDQVVQLLLSFGTADVRLRHLDSGQYFVIDTADASISLLQPGSYRIDASGDGAPRITTRSGEAEVTFGNVSFSVFPRQTAFVSAAAAPSYEIQGVVASDSWDYWCLARDRNEDRIASAGYVSTDMTGWQDLEAHGIWRIDVTWGPVWEPLGVPAGWAPYRFGHWVRLEPWGWTWIDNEPWGFAPFHYGRWDCISGRWVWVPGPFVPHPIFAPALVVFLGRDGRVEGFEPHERMGWFPLGPHEPYVPPYRVSRDYLHGINNNREMPDNARVPRTSYVNRFTPGSVTAAGHGSFMEARPVVRTPPPPNTPGYRPFGGITKPLPRGAGIPPSVGNPRMPGGPPAVGAPSAPHGPRIIAAPPAAGGPAQHGPPQLRREPAAPQMQPMTPQPAPPRADKKRKPPRDR